MPHKTVTILVGEEPYLIDRQLKIVKDEAQKAGPMDFNFDAYSAKSDPIEKILSSCDAMSMMGEFRTVLVKDAQDFKKEQHDLMLSYFEKPVPTTRLVLVASKLDGRQKIWKRVAELGFVVNLKPPYENELPGFISKEAQSLGIKISSEAVYEIIQNVGTSLMTLVGVLSQLKLFVLPRSEITLADVESLVGFSAQSTVFKFAEMVGRLQYAQASAVLDTLLEEGESPVLILAMIARHFRLLLLAQEGLSLKQSSGDIAKNLGVPPFFVQTYLDQVKKISKPRLTVIYRNILETDRDLKRSPLPNKDVLDRFLIKACLG